MGKGEIARNKQFLLFPVFLTAWRTFDNLSAICIKLEIVICKPFEFGRVYNLSFGKGLIRSTLKGTQVHAWSKIVGADYIQSNNLYKE